MRQACEAGRLVLPLPPSKNASHKQFVRGKRIQRVLSDQARDFIEQARWTSIEWMNKTGWTMPEPGTKVIMRYWTFWPDRRKRDPANMIDMLADSLKGVLFPDDDILLPRAMDYAIDRENPRLEVELEIMETVEAVNT
ncbi:MAG: RusA family crossover junction endodeoxyribonuclease [Alicyclobacillus sp.]|nr:RusA family crossover junction endodeoxyribonuclease [Alicyclobacillus sp.]